MGKTVTNPNGIPRYTWQDGRSRGTNFHQWIGGDMEFSFEISSFERMAGDEKKAWMEMLEDCGAAYGVQCIYLERESGNE